MGTNGSSHAGTTSRFRLSDNTQRWRELSEHRTKQQMRPSFNGLPDDGRQGNAEHVTATGFPYWQFIVLKSGDASITWVKKPSQHHNSKLTGVDVSPPTYPSQIIEKNLNNKSGQELWEQPVCHNTPLSSKIAHGRGKDQFLQIGMPRRAGCWARALKRHEHECAWDVRNPLYSTNIASMWTIKFCGVDKNPNTSPGRFRKIEKGLSSNHCKISSKRYSCPIPPKERTFWLSVWLKWDD